LYTYIDLATVVVCAGSADAADPVLSPLPEGPQPGTPPTAADTQRAHQYTPRHGRSEEIQTHVLMNAIINIHHGMVEVKKYKPTFS